MRYLKKTWKVIHDVSTKKAVTESYNFDSINLNQCEELIIRLSNMAKIYLQKLSLPVGVRSEGRRGGNPPGLKIFRARNPEWWKIFQYSEKFQGNSDFQHKSKVAQKSWMTKNVHSIKWIQGTLCFSRQTQVAQKSWMIKNIFNTVKIFGANSVFQDERKVAQKSWMVKNIFNTVKFFRANSVFHAKRKLLKNPE